MFFVEVCYIFRKDHVGQECTAAKKWPDNWSFLATKYEDVRNVFLITDR